MLEVRSLPDWRVVDRFVAPSWVRTIDIDRERDVAYLASSVQGVWALDLTTVADFLTEQTVFVVNAVTDSRHVQSSQRVDEASSQTTQTTVTQSHVRLFFTQIGDVDAQILESLTADFVQ